MTAFADYRRRDGRIGAALLAVLALAAVFAPLIAPGDPLAIVGPPLLSPFTDLAAPLGTDRLGRDVLALVVHGSRTTLVVGLASAAFAVAAGAAVGAAAGLAGGWLDEALMRATEAVQTVPGFLLALAFISVAGPSVPSIVVAISLGAWPGPARLVRAEVLSIRERDFVVAARAIGMHPAEIAWREVLPLALPPAVSLVSVIVAGAILGLGDPNVATWGGLIAEGRAVLRTAPFLSIVPGLALLLAVLGVHLAGEGIARRLSAPVRP
jgi:peptide/nickel transport system permease protein